MNRIGLTLLLLIHTYVVNHSFTQRDYAIKADIGFLRFQYNTVQIDPGPDWLGYYLNGENGIDFNLSYGLNFNNKFFTGLGIGYLNFEGIDGFSVFSEVNYSPLISRFNPLINLRIGYSHIWNQYENGTGTPLADLCGGFRYIISNNVDVFALSGITLAQQSLLIPIRFGFYVRIPDPNEVEPLPGPYD